MGADKRKPEKKKEVKISPFAYHHQTKPESWPVFLWSPSPLENAGHCWLFRGYADPSASLESRCMLAYQQ